MVICSLLLVSCAHTKISQIPSEAGKRFYYSETDFLNYEVVGRGEIPVLFFHGLGGSLRNWDDVISYLPKDTFTAYLVDLKGFGLSSKPRDSHYSIKDNVELVCRFIIANGLKNFVLVGHSLGGGIALCITLESLVNPQLKPRNLVLIDAAAYKTDPPFFIKFVRIPVLGKLLLSLLSAEFKATFTLKKIIYDRKKITPKLIERYTAFMDQDGYNYALMQSSEDLISHHYQQCTQNYQQCTQNYRYILYPVLVVWGKEDSAIPLSFGAQLIQDLPNAKIQVIERCGHNPHEEFPKEVADLIISFIMPKEEYIMRY